MTLKQKLSTPPVFAVPPVAVALVGCGSQAPAGARAAQSNLHPATLLKLLFCSLRSAVLAALECGSLRSRIKSPSGYALGAILLTYSQNVCSFFCNHDVQCVAHLIRKNCISDMQFLHIKTEDTIYIYYRYSFRSSKTKKTQQSISQRSEPVKNKQKNSSIAAVFLCLRHS